MRKPFIAGNWKMNMTVAEGKDLAGEIRRRLEEDPPAADVAVCPPFTALQAVGEVLNGSCVAWGAQHMHFETSGAFTGEVAAPMLVELGCSLVILGHSERRQFFGETNEKVNRKVFAAIEQGLRPIVCVGETLEQREESRTRDVVIAQVREGLAGLSAEQWNDLVIAYEPVWAIGTGLTATPQQAQEVHRMIRSLAAEMVNDEVADKLIIQYGGSMKPANAADLLAQPDIDGGLIGGAALKSDSFVEIIKAAAG